MDTQDEKKWDSTRTDTAATSRVPVDQFSVVGVYATGK